MCGGEIGKVEGELVGEGAGDCAGEGACGCVGEGAGGGVGEGGGAVSLGRHMLYVHGLSPQAPHEGGHSGVGAWQ